MLNCQVTCFNSEDNEQISVKCGSEHRHYHFIALPDSMTLSKPSHLTNKCTYMTRIKTDMNTYISRDV